MSAGERYSFSLTTFSPSGKLVQIEYALNAVNAGQPTVGIKAKDGTVIVRVEKYIHIFCIDYTPYAFFDSTF